MMTTYEALSLMIAFAMMLIALLAYIDRNNKRKQINSPTYDTALRTTFRARENLSGVSPLRKLHTI